MDLKPEYLDEPVEPLVVSDERPAAHTKRFLVVRAEGVRIEHRIGDTTVRRFVVISDRGLRERLKKPRETELEPVVKPVDDEYLERSARLLLGNLVDRLDAEPRPQGPQRLATLACERRPARPDTQAAGCLVFFGRRPGVEQCLEVLSEQGELVQIAGTLQLKDALDESGAQFGDRIEVERTAPRGADMRVVGSRSPVGANPEGEFVVTMIQEGVQFEPSPVDWPFDGGPGEATDAGRHRVHETAHRHE